MRIVFDKRLFLLLSFAFIIATVIGTLSHELGHYFVAKSLGYKASLHYASSDWDYPGSDSVNVIISRYWKQIEEGSTFPGKETFVRLTSQHSNDGFWITMGGPLQTMLTGTIGLILLFVWKSSFQSRQRLTPRQWTLVFITLFWLRQAANLVLWLVAYLVTKEFFYKGDEVKMALQLALPFWSLRLITGIIGVIILYIVIFKFIPKSQRLTFVLSGLAGGVSGFILWMYWLGPLFLP